MLQGNLIYVCNAAGTYLAALFNANRFDAYGYTVYNDQLNFASVAVRK